MGAASLAPLFFVEKVWSGYRSVDRRGGTLFRPWLSDRVYAFAYPCVVGSGYAHHRPQDLEISQTKLQVQGSAKSFWLYVAAAALIATGFADFPLIAFHFQKYPSPMKQ